MDRETRLKRLRFRSWHRGTREADFMIGGFFDHASAGWNDAEIGWFEALMDEQDVDIMAWAMRRAAPPLHVEGPMMEAMRRLDYVPIAW
ncbi:MAG: succinate dehydrogenase assembly factor 2 [Sphingomonadaceae bacterium]|nr:succinate dehydrogenase assembly factor 2 [Sphingomonadaceae bacterium]